MRIRVIGWGSNWWLRPGTALEDKHRFTRSAAYFNTTGICCGKRIRRHWIVPGLVRFNGVSNFSPAKPLRTLGKVFECSELGTWEGGNRILFKSYSPLPPERYLVTASSDEHGRFDFLRPDWKSATALLFAASQLREKQEVMLLMKLGDRVQTSCGSWTLIEESPQRLPCLLLS